MTGDPFDFGFWFESSEFVICDFDQRLAIRTIFDFGLGIRNSGLPIWDLRFEICYCPLIPGTWHLDT
jgi:hypothetical protein